MLEPDKHSSQSDSGDDADHPRQPEIAKLSSLYERLSKVEKGSSEHKQIQEEIGVVKENMAAQQECIRRLVNALEWEQVYELVSSMRILDKRFQAQVSELLEADLTELRRLNRFIREQAQEAKRRLANSRQDKRQAGK
jgi:hypothetical protein